jgi:acyl dehydratase
MSYGRYFEELKTGDEFKHWPGRTINEFDDTLLSLLSMNQHPIHLDEHFARQTQHGRRLVAGPTVIAIVIGMTQGDIGGRAVATLSYADVRHANPVFHGDTLYADSTVGETGPVGTVLGGHGTVTIETRAVNQNGELVLSLRHKIMVPVKGLLAKPVENANCKQ